MRLVLAPLYPKPPEMSPTWAYAAECAALFAAS